MLLYAGVAYLVSCLLIIYFAGMIRYWLHVILGNYTLLQYTHNVNVILNDIIVCYMVWVCLSSNAICWYITNVLQIFCVANW